MDVHDITRELNIKNDSKIVMLVADGLGGLPLEPGGLTELETANTPNLDALAERGISGGSIPVLPGISPGSGPGHLALFGYDPLKYVIGRGALEATGIGFELGPNDVAIRGNFCTLDAAGNITDRRAGRIASEESAPLGRATPPGEAPRRRGLRRAGQGASLRRRLSRRRSRRPRERHRPAKDRRAAARSRRRRSRQPAHRRSRHRVHRTSHQAAGPRKEGQRADAPRLLGQAGAAASYEEVYGLRAAAIAVYPMYKGLARLVGMDIVGKAQTLAEQMARPHASTGTATISSSSTSNTPTAPARTATSTPR